MLLPGMKSASNSSAQAEQLRQLGEVDRHAALLVAERRCGDLDR
jgi:hypothetical protein